MPISHVTKSISICAESDHPESAAEHGFDAIVNVASEVNYGHPQGVEYRHVPLTDDEQNSCAEINRAVDALSELVSKGKRVLVHCIKGRSRAPSIVAAHLSRQGGYSLHSALEMIKDKRQIVNPRDEFLASVAMCQAMKGKR
jgi:protein-tyrosine phosphatase